MTIIHGDCLDVMKSYPDNYFSCIVTDPPYGLKFMGKDWDYGIPGIPFWKVALRICKPGSWMLAFGGTRTYHRLTCSIEDSGWEIRDCIMWMYGSGFPKGKGCLKPAYEPIIMARKGGCKVSEHFLNIDECRIEGSWNRSTKTRDDIRGGNFIKNESKTYECEPQSSHEKGRWPANIILDEEAGKMLDEQTGILKSGKLNASSDESQECNKGLYNHGRKLRNVTDFPSSSGGASRFFYCAKSSPSERNGSIHPTMKPLKLMEYLIKLVMKPEGLLLDPFSGSGTTILAAKNLGFNAVGIEKCEEYCEIARERCKNMMGPQQGQQGM